MALYLINHPESTLGHALHHGDIDAPLSTKGIAQVGPISEVFRKQKLDLIATPSKERNSGTAILLASLTGAPVFVDEGLRTWKQGAFSGWPHTKVNEALKVYLRNPDVKVPQGESANHFLKRFKRTISKYQGMADMGKLGIALILNSVSIDAVAGRFKTVDLAFNTDDGDVYLVGPGLTLKEL